MGTHQKCLGEALLISTHSLCFCGEIRKKLSRYFSYLELCLYVQLQLQFSSPVKAKLSCILHHWGVQLILACSWARPAILSAGMGRGEIFLFLQFLHFHSFSSFNPVPLFHLLYCLFYLSSPFLWEMTQNDPQGLTCR